MEARKLLAALVVVSLVIAALPAAAFADAGTTSTTAPASTPVRASIDRAIAATGAAARTEEGKPLARSIEAPAQGPGGGGGRSKMWMVWTVIGTVASASTAYYLIKETKKQARNSEP